MNIELPPHLQFLVLPIQASDKSSASLVVAAKACWRRVWEHARQAEMNIAEPLDDYQFTNHDEVALLLDNGRVVALATLKVLDLKSVKNRSDPALTVWPSAILDEISCSSRHVLVPGNFAVDFPFRQNKIGFPVKDVFIGLIAKHASEMAKMPLIAAARRGKSVHLAAYRTGARCLSSNIPYTIHGQYVDLLIWDNPLSPTSI